MAQYNFCRLDSGQLIVDPQMDLIGTNTSRVMARLRAVDRYVAFPGMTPRARPMAAIGSSEFRTWPLTRAPNCSTGLGHWWSIVTLRSGRSTS